MSRSKPFALCFYCSVFFQCLNNRVARLKLSHSHFASSANHPKCHFISHYKLQLISDFKMPVPTKKTYLPTPLGPPPRVVGVTRRHQPAQPSVPGPIPKSIDVLPDNVSRCTFHFTISCVSGLESRVRNLDRKSVV